MIWDVVKAAVNQPKERIGGQMLTYLWCNDGHGKPRHENITSFKSGGIFASRFTKCQCSSHGEHSPWRLSGNCWYYSRPLLLRASCSPAASGWRLLRRGTCSTEGCWRLLRSQFPWLTSLGRCSPPG